MGWDKAYRFFAAGILAIVALALVLTYLSAQTGLESWASEFIRFATLALAAWLVLGVIGRIRPSK